MTSPGRIDTHQHYLPPFYRELMDARGVTAGGWPTPAWSKEAALAFMDAERIATGVLSLSSPGTHFGDDNQARKTARAVNEYGAALVKDHPDRFGLFASLPLPDVEGALIEVEYAMDSLHADGVVLLSNAHGTYLGDHSYEPLWAELDRREAVVFIHPDAPPIPMLDGMPSPLLDFPFDTTRTAMHMVVNGVMSRHPNLKVILSHAGGFLPYAAYRFTGISRIHPDLTADAVMTDLKRFYFDTALSSTPSAMPSLLAFADPTHITYGSDFPYAPNTHAFNEMLDGYHIDHAAHARINRGNAETLFPRFMR